MKTYSEILLEKANLRVNEWLIYFEKMQQRKLSFLGRIV